MKHLSLRKFYKKKILLLLFISSVFSIAYYYGIDEKLIVLTAFILSVFTEVFVGVGALIAAIPIIGPMPNTKSTNFAEFFVCPNS